MSRVQAREEAGEGGGAPSLQAADAVGGAGEKREREEPAVAKDRDKKKKVRMRC